MNQTATPDRQLLMRIIKRIPFFAGLQDWEYEMLLTICHVSHHAAGSELFHAGEPGHHMYLLLSGSLEISTPGGQIQLQLKPGEVIGEIAVVTTPPRRSADAIILEDSILIAINREEVEALVSSAPRVSYLIMRNVARVLAERLIANNRRIDHCQ
jgi:CRP/FNR family transcriptional regulator, cyclic AMP receptor protein